MARPHLAAIGDVLVDVTVLGGRGHDAKVELRAGGSAANVAAWAAHLGARASVYARVGADLAGEAIRQALRRRGVQAQLSVDPGARTGTFVLVHGERFVDRGANASFAAEHLPPAIEADVVVVSRWLEHETARTAVRRAKADWVVGLGRPLSEANAVVLSETETEEGVHVLAAHHRLACVTLGRLGALAILDGEERSASAPVVQSTDTTGAGDAFAAAMLVALARGSALADALGEACRVGAEAAASPTGWPVVK